MKVKSDMWLPNITFLVNEASREVFMSYFDNPDNVQEYIKMCEGYDGKFIIGELKKNLKEGSSILELGMGPGKDMDMLNDSYEVTGSDTSQIFLDLYKENHPDADLMKLDAIDMKIDRKFDCIYSNKVLQHLSKDNLGASFAHQVEKLNDGGILFHTFWYGNKEEVMQSLLFNYYTEETIKAIIGDRFEIVTFKRYTEIEPDDSFFIVLKQV